MCNLYNTKASREEVRAYFEILEETSRLQLIEKDYAAPGKPGLVVREEDGAVCSM